MAVSDGSALLLRAAKDLQIAWMRARANWSDDMALAFQREHIEPLEKDLRSAGTALDMMSEIMHRLRRDCE